MDSLMQDDWQMVVPKIIDYAARVHATQTIVSRCVEDPGAESVTTYAAARERAARATLALRRLGVRPGDRVATLAWNTTRHFEAWFAIPGAGAVCHTLNPRLFDPELEYIINHAEDCIILADISFVDLLARLLPRLPTVRAVVYLTDAAHMPAPPPGAAAAVLCYETLLAAETAGLRGFRWTECTENQACGLCYTSGTTGKPKGVLYSHRANYLLSMSACLPDALNIASASTFLVLVPLFHANAWGIPFAVPFVGAKLVLPGPYLDGASIHGMMERHRVTHSAGVPTLWQGLADFLSAGAPAGGAPALSTLRRLVIGGAPAPRHMVEFYEGRFGVTVIHLWGMTELAPLGTVGGVKGTVAARAPDPEARMALKLKQGWPLVFVDMRIVDDAGAELPWDGKTFGVLQVRGPHTLRRYYRAPAPAVDGEGWFDTGDVATIDAEGHMAITDRAKDVIKSGGEWISSIEIENLAAGHPGVAEAAVIGVPHPKWGERPLLVVVPRGAGAGRVAKEDLLRHLEGKIARWWIPDDVAFVDEIPHTATGKISKVQLRQKLKDHPAVTQGVGPRKARL